MHAIAESVTHQGLHDVAQQFRIGYDDRAGSR